MTCLRPHRLFVADPGLEAPPLTQALDPFCIALDFSDAAKIQAQVGMASDSSSHLLPNTSYVKCRKTQLTTETVFQMTRHGSGMSPSQGPSDTSKPVRAVFPHRVFV